ncbi:thioesterase-like superfamily-domain-containing protein [Xylogone sp. PMI_703]|nr:thioesterase-like superfamily-domain-containing protein [Xylogone sp. PMI_703]
MANAHLPNSHPSVTPNWKPLGYATVPFSKATSATPIKRSDNSFSAFAPKDWCSPGVLGPHAHGGYCAALIISTCQNYFSKKYLEKNQPDTIHLQIQFLSPLLQGLINIVINDLKIGSKHSVLQAELRDSKGIPCVIAFVTQGNLSASDDYTIEMPVSPVPDRVKDCQRWVDPVFFYHSPTSSKARSFTVKGGPNPLWSPSVGKNARDMWIKWDDENDSLTTAHLGFIFDLLPPLIFNYEKSGLNAALKWATPTMCLDIDFKSSCKGEEWILQRTVMNQCNNGKLDMVVKLLNESGKLLGIATHTTLVIPHPQSKRASKVKAIL